VTDADRLKRELTGLYALARAQRSLRLGLRAFWLGAAGTMLGWGVNALWGWLPNPLSWFLTGLAFALVPFAALAASLLPQSRWVWRLDRRLELQEQVSTAWEVVQKKQGGRLSDSLVEEVAALLPQVRERMLKRGWFLKADLVSTMIVLLLASILLASGWLKPLSDLLNETPAALVPLPAQPRPPDQETQGQPPASQPPQAGAPPQEGPPGGAPPAEAQPGQDPGGSPSPNMGEVGDALRQMGSDISGQAGTYDLGQALENLDLNGAAGALDELNGQLDELSQESLDNLSEAMKDAAGPLGEAGAESLSKDLGEAADALQGENGEANQPLDEVAGDLRDLADQMENSAAGGPNAGIGNSGGTGNPEPLTRLSEEGADFDLPLDDPASSGLLSPAPPDAAGEGTASGSLDSTYQPGDEAFESPLLPNSLPWKWRDVVSEYFQR